MKKMVAKMMMAMVTMGLVFGHVSVTSYAAEESKEEISVDWEEEEETDEQPETEQPETEQPETEQPETEQPETEQPEETTEEEIETVEIEVQNQNPWNWTMMNETDVKELPSTGVASDIMFLVVAVIAAILLAVSFVKRNNNDEETTVVSFVKKAVVAAFSVTFGVALVALFVVSNAIDCITRLIKKFVSRYAYRTTL